jgi:DNA-binding NarL/FixJ family response regulator
MVVDDQADVRFLIRVVLRDHPGVEVVAEADGAAAALAAVGSAAPDVALVDARMPVMDGFELAPQLLAAAPGLRIAVLTTIVDEVVEADARAAGAVACLSKDDVDGLPETILELAAR